MSHNDNDKENEEDQQSKITSYFIREIRKQVENKNTVDENDIREDNTEEFSLNTQEIIEDARERRSRKTQNILCEQCDFISSSKTLIQRHIASHHEVKEYQCNQCDVKAI